MATRNSRRAALYLSATLGGSYTRASRTHGLKLNVPTDFSEDTAHGARFKSYLPGLQDFKATLMSWYDHADATLRKNAVNKTSEYFLIYPDNNDTTEYIRGQCFFGWNDLDLDIGKTIDENFTLVIANADIDIISAGSSILT